MTESESDETACQSTEQREQALVDSSKKTDIQIAGYELLDPLGQGSFGEVWLATNERTEQRVAVKILKARENLDWEFFRREMDSLREVTEHPFVLTVLDADLNHDPPFIVTPYLTEGALDKKTPDIKQAITWIEQIAEGLEYTHDKGLVHCDLKPSNILLDDQGRVRVADYGQSVRSEANQGSWGTLGYMSPEQANLSLSSPEPLWDIYSFGATAYYLLTHQRPRLSKLDARLLSEAGNTGRRFELYRELLAERELKPVVELNPSVDHDLAALVEACLSIKPEARPQTMKAVREDLKRRRDGRLLLCRKPWGPKYIIGTYLRRPMVRMGSVAVIAIVLALGAGPTGSRQPPTTPTPPQKAMHVGPFEDIESATAKKDIQNLRRARVVDSTDENFRPNEPIKRSDFCRWLVRSYNFVYPEKAIRLASGKHSQFTDVPHEHPDFPYIQSLHDAGFLPETEQIFRPDAPLTREYAIYAKSLLDGGDAQMNGNCGQPYIDIHEAQPEYHQVLHNYDNSGYGSQNFQRVYGNSRKFHPKREVSRAEAATLCSTFGYSHWHTSVEQKLQK